MSGKHRWIHTIDGGGIPVRMFVREVHVTIKSSHESLSFKTITEEYTLYNTYNTYTHTHTYIYIYIYEYVPQTDGPLLQKLTIFRGSQPNDDTGCRTRVVASSIGSPSSPFSCRVRCERRPLGDSCGPTRTFDLVLGCPLPAVDSRAPLWKVSKRNGERTFQVSVHRRGLQLVHKPCV